ncbi:MAG: DNA-directed RNA polymerase subunit alpha [Chloroflexi bacterium]|nr:DNA-directed RNA polymerase subunit alpha [Chloroflexota bacterium]
MSQLVVPKIASVETGENFGRFLVEPLEKGIGVTLGNAMRRVLLSQLPGAAVTRVKINDIQHEFTTVPNAKEDVIDFLLNIKALRIIAHADRPGKLILEVEGARDVSAADLKPSADFEIVNPDLHLITLDSDDAQLYAELDVEVSRGFREAESSGSFPLGVIPMDAVFSPVRKVNFGVEPMRIGQESGHERMTLEVWTDGTISPAEAISHSAEIIVEQLSPFVSYSRVSQVREEPARLAIPAQLYDMPVEQLSLSIRTLNCLRRGGINTVGELLSRGEKDLMALRNFGQKSKQELEERLAKLDLYLFSQARERKEGAGAQEEEFTESAQETVS